MTLTTVFKYSGRIIPALGLAACMSGADPESTTRTSTATIDNLLPVDGCSYIVHVDGNEYAPDAESLSLIKARHVPYPSVTAAIDYRLTGRTGQVECGFLTHRDLPEISLSFND